MVLRRGASHLPAQGTRRRGGRSGPGPSRPDPAGPGRPSPPPPRPEPAWDPAPRAHGRPRKPAPGQVQKSRAEASLSETERRPRPAGPGPPLPRRPRRAGSALGRRGLGEEQQRTARGSKATGGPAATARFARQRPSWTRHFPAGLEPLRPAGSAAPATPARKRFLFCFFSPPPKQKRRKKRTVSNRYNSVNKNVTFSPFLSILCVLRCSSGLAVSYPFQRICFQIVSWTQPEHIFGEMSDKIF